MWTAAPVLILAAIATFVFVKLPGIQDVPNASAAGEALQVRVTGRQFYWQFEYPNGVIAINRLVAPQGRHVRLTVTAPDVRRDPFLVDPGPQRQDGRAPRGRQPPVVQGRAHGRLPRASAPSCAGSKHAKMLAEVEVLPAAEFDRWLEERRSAQTPGTSDLGEELWTGVCAKCHGLRGQGRLRAADRELDAS